MSTTWTPALDVLQGAAQRLGKVVDEMSGGRFRIEVFPGGQLMPPLECFAAEPGTVTEFGFDRKAYEALPVDLQRTLDHAAEVVQISGLTEYQTKNALALGRLKTEFRGKVEVLQLPAPVLRDLRKLSAEVVREESEKSPTARKVHASFTKFQVLLRPWDLVAESAYHQFVA
jgi:TRAP-type mannitol/chloroaromatic compound transport system substrate-binding protein